MSSKTIAGLVALAGGLFFGSAAPAEYPSPRVMLVSATVEADQVQTVVNLGLDVWSVQSEVGRVSPTELDRQVEPFPRYDRQTEPSPRYDRRAEPFPRYDRRAEPALRFSQERVTLTIRVSPDELRDLRARGYEPVVIDPNVYDTWERIAGSSKPGDAGRGDWTAYHNLDSTNAMLVELHESYPDRSALLTIGDSVESRPINGIRISDDAATVDPLEPAVLIVGCHHAREWISVEVALYIAERLLVDYDTDPEVASLVDRSEIWIVPVDNPDGYLYTATVDRMWRKNRRDNGDGTFGIDLNRNYSYEWGGPGSSGSPGSTLYRGPYAFSEPETAAISDLFDSRSFAAGLTYHSYSQYVMSPWGFTTFPPRHTVQMEALVAEMAGEINAAHTNPQYDYVSGRWGVLLYIASGIFVDWVYGEHGVFAAIVELRPSPSGGGGFLLPTEQILGTCVENYAGALHMLQRVIGPASSVDGDFDADGATGLSDFAFLQECLSGPAESVPAFPIGCHACDLSGDAHIDMDDFRLFQGAFTGP